MTIRNSPVTGSEAIKYIEENLGFSLKELSGFPKYFTIETINACNARCIMCGIDFNSKKLATTPDVLFDKMVNEITRYSKSVERVMLYLDGEPLLDKTLCLRIRKMKDAGVKKVMIATNASLLGKERAVQIIEAGLDLIYIGIDSLDKDVFERIRRGLNFETVYNNIIDFIRLRDQLNQNLTIRIQMIQQELNFNEADSFARHWRSLLSHNDQIVVQKAHNWASAVKVMEFGDEDKVNNIPCFVLWSTFCVHVNGDVGLCCMDSKSQVLLGNLYKQSIEEIWTGEVLRNAREKHLNGQRDKIPICNGCTLWRESKHAEEETMGH